MMDHIYNFWQDEKHIRGILRRTTVAKYNQNKPDWETVIDIDQIAKDENKNWVWKESTCLQDDVSHCLIFLSDGGKDATVAREYNLAKREFKKNGFIFPEGKHEFSWYDQDTLIWGDGNNELTASGYPSLLKVIKRTQRLDEAKVIDHIEKDLMSISSFDLYDYHLKSNKIKKYSFCFIVNSFYSYEYYYFNDLQSYNSKIRLPIPKGAELSHITQDQVVFTVKKEFISNNKTYPPGSVLSFNLSDLDQKQINFKTVFTPTDTQFFQGLYKSKNQLWLSTLDNIRKRMNPIQFKNDQWVIESFDPVNNLGQKLVDGNMIIDAISSYTNDIYFNYSDFLTPNQQLHYSTESLKNNSLQLVKSTKSSFDSQKFVAHQYFAISKDGAKIPYYIIHKKNIVLDGQNPTLLYGYGGFEYALTPNYLLVPGKVWLSRGGVQVYANIRGGGEFGPKWHQAALRENRQKAYDDFIAIAEDLIQRKITSPKHLGIQGQSNGGLLTGVMLTQRPDLFNAVISEVPLANMLTYHRLLSGASWVAEYGNPDILTDREYLLKYSPLQNLKAGQNYPEPYIMTSAKDDRVHPAHARQMVARLRELGYPVIYFENKDGGHAGSANLVDRASVVALPYTYLIQKLMSK